MKALNIIGLERRELACRKSNGETKPVTCKSVSPDLRAFEGIRGAVMLMKRRRNISALVDL